MQRRSYEFYEVWRNLGSVNEERLVRGELIHATRFFECHPDQESDLFLVRVSVLTIRKVEKLD